MTAPHTSRFALKIAKFIFKANLSERTIGLVISGSALIMDKVATTPIGLMDSFAYIGNIE